MAKQTLLIVDPDPESQRVLEVSLRKAGFSVTEAINGLDALTKIATAMPDLIISNTEMPEMDGFALYERLREDPELATIPFIFLTDKKSVESKIRGLELGVEDYLTKPIFVREILARINLVLQRRQRERLERRGQKTNFSGTLGDMGVVDLIQTIDISRKSGVIRLTAENDQGEIYFLDGRVIDAETRNRKGADAVYRMLVWSEGTFEVEFGTPGRDERIPVATQSLLMEGMRRLDEWGRIQEQLPPLDSIFDVDADALLDRLSEIPDEINGVVRQFDGRRTLLEVVDRCPMGDLEALSTIVKLYFEGLITAVPLEEVEQRMAAPEPAPGAPVEPPTAALPALPVVPPDAHLPPRSLRNTGRHPVSSPPSETRIQEERPSRAPLPGRDDFVAALVRNPDGQPTPAVGQPPRTLPSREPLSARQTIGGLADPVRTGGSETPMLDAAIADGPVRTGHTLPPAAPPAAAPPTGETLPLLAAPAPRVRPPMKWSAAVEEIADGEFFEGETYAATFGRGRQEDVTEPVSTATAKRNLSTQPPPPATRRSSLPPPASRSPAPRSHVPRTGSSGPPPGGGRSRVPLVLAIVAALCATASVVVYRLLPEATANQVPTSSPSASTVTEAAVVPASAASNEPVPEPAAKVVDAGAPAIPPVADGTDEAYADLLKRSEKARHRERIELLRAAIAVKPRGDEALALLASLLMENRATQAESLDLAARAVAANPDNALGWLVQGYVAQLEDRRDAAEEAYRRCAACSGPKMYTSECQRLVR